MSGRDLDSDIARMHGIEDESESEKAELSPVECPRCKEKNGPDASFCQRCGQALSHEAFQKLEREEGFSDEVAEKIDEMEATGSLGELIDKAVEKRVKEEMEKVRGEISEGEEPT
ncbi:hypothetical protein AKJ41_01895 [candidate division MSBL1 archaeon SCGC-AAA259O05]|uniref:Zinc-ribbon domain-containing protein n=1 Tax=candidate division MSBL1 archaeon SCGC-AAA259O05 TaxID=1698271 RepID=A0A133V4G6_9EURY|nr:hypothetical protein AKJ41_01895 [candidate division MSBL1 archaeon SCGC-AAA259O05]